MNKLIHKIFGLHNWQILADDAKFPRQYFTFYCTICLKAKREYLK